MAWENESDDAAAGVDWTTTPFVLKRYDRERSQGSDEWTDIARFDSVQSAWAAGSLLQYLLPIEQVNCQYASGEPSLAVWKQIALHRWVKLSDCNQLDELSHALVSGLKAAKVALDQAEAPYPF